MVVVDVAHVEIALLGPLEVTGSEVGAAGSGLAGRERALLARLALDVGRPVGVERLIDDLWGEDPPAGARNTLQVYVSHLRRALGPDLVESGTGGYRLALDRSAVDAHRFADWVSSGAALVAAGRAAEAVSALDQALGLWRGDPLAGLDEYGFARLEAARLGELRAGAVENLAEVELARGRHDRVVAEFGPLVTQFPFRERLRAAVMTGLYRQGRAADALEIYRTGQAVLREELGLDPGPGLRALQAAILAEDPGLVVAAPRARDLGALPPPAPATPLLGRAVEVAAVAGLVADPGVRLVSVLGPGGTGKTRLVLEVANHPPEPFTGAVVWVSLVGSDDAVLVLPAVGAALRLPATRIGVEEVAAAVAGGPVLLVVDNLEHLLPGAADVVTELLARCPELTILATSRVAARAAGEHRFALGSLPVPDPGNPAADDQATTAAESGSAILEAVRDNPAVALFTARAAQVRPGFDLDAGNAGAVVGICARLDGLPLALELAAARVGVLEPATMLARLESRLSLLTAAGGEIDGRHQSLRATLDWSHRLLSPAGAWLIAVLSVFRSGFTLPAVEDVLRRLDPGSDNPAKVAAEDDGVWVVNTFQELVDASLVSPEPRADGGADGRFQMLETIIEYAGEKLAATGHETAAREAHCAYYRHAATSRWASVPLQPRTVIEVDWYLAEQDNLRTAILWAQTTGDHTAFADLVTTTAGHWVNTGNWTDAEHWLQAVADHPGAGIRRSDAEHWLAVGAWARGSLADALVHADREVQEGQEHAEVDLGRYVLALSHRGFMRHFAGMADDCKADCEATIALVPEVDDLTIQAMALLNASVGWLDDRAAARDLFLRAKETAIRAGDDHVRGAALNDLAELALTAGDGDEALHWCSEAERLEITSRQPMEWGHILSIKAGAFLLSGDMARARVTLRESLPVAARTGEMRMIAEGALFGAAVAAAGDAREAAVLLGSHEETLRTLGQQRIDSSVTVYDRYLADLDQRLDAATLHACLERGARLSTVELVDWLSNDQAPAMDSATLSASVTS